MVLAHHTIFSMYGFWLPNDPRGSGSDYVGAWNLFRYGRATKTDAPRSVAGVEHDRHLRLAAKRALKYPPVEISGVQAVAIAAGFADACNEAGYLIHACAILPDHVHLVIGYHVRNIRAIVGHLKSNATRELKARRLWPADDSPLWGGHGWNVRLETLTHVERAIRYVENNPLKEGKRRQSWSFVTPFNLDAATARARAAGQVAKRRIGGAALKCHEEKLKREQRVASDAANKTP